MWAHLHISAYPFAAVTLRTMLDYMSSTLEELVGDLALHTGGVPALNPSDWGGTHAEADVPHRMTQRRGDGTERDARPEQLGSRG